MMMLGLGLLLQRLTAQKVLFLLLFAEVFGPFGVVTLHFEAFFGAEVWKVTDKEDELPAIVRWAVAAECGHACEANAVFDNPENLTVGKILGFGLTEVGRLGVQTPPHHGVTTAIVAVADGTMVREVEASLAKDLGRRGDGIFSCARVAWPRKAARVAGQCGFQSGRRGTRTEAVVQDRSGSSSEQPSAGDENQKEESAALHVNWVLPS